MTTKDRVPTKTISDRFDVIRRYLQRSSVLDLGIVDARPAKGSTADRVTRHPNLLFRRIVEINPGAVGVDLDKEGIEALRRAGFNVVCADAQTMDLGRQFEVIVAGELIEHLDNPGGFLANVKRHLARDGVLILTTPNPFYAKQKWKIWRYGRPQVHEDHTCWFDPITLGGLIRRMGLDPFDGYWIQPPSNPLKAWPQYLRPYFSHSFMALARHAPGLG
jgi:SAM-dependent methyltransferase